MDQLKVMLDHNSLGLKNKYSFNLPFVLHQSITATNKAREEMLESLHINIHNYLSSQILNAKLSVIL